MIVRILQLSWDGTQNAGPYFFDGSLYAATYWKHLNTCCQYHSLETCLCSTFRSDSALKLVRTLFFRAAVFFRDSLAPLLPLSRPALQSCSYHSLQPFVRHSQGTIRAAHRCRKCDDLCRAVEKESRTLRRISGVNRSIEGKEDGQIK